MKTLPDDLEKHLPPDGSVSLSAIAKALAKVAAVLAASRSIRRRRDNQLKWYSGREE